MPDRAVRLSQTLTPFGVGAIYDLLGESFVACDISRWQKHSARLLSAPRLSAALKVGEFREAPTRSPSFSARAAAGIPYARFPRWLFCGSCRRMVHWLLKFEVPGEPARCGSCGSKRALVPMRFVTVCRQGHLDDVPWGIWAHSSAEEPEQKQCERHELRFLTNPAAGGGLKSLVIRCDTCRAQRTLSGITASGSLAQVNIRCRGIQPWQSPRPELAHDDTPEVVQRGASNVYSGHIESSIDIPPHSKFDAGEEVAFAIRATPSFEVIVGAPQGPAAVLLTNALAREFGVPDSTVEALVQAEVQRRAGGQAPVALDDDLLGGEWIAFQTPHTEADDRDRFITRHVSLDGLRGDQRSGLVAALDKVVQVVRLREVRALTGFSRLPPGGILVAPDLGRGLDWLPAIEVYGEGIFLSFEEAVVRTWESGPASERAAVLAPRWDSSFQRSRLPEPTARFVMLHTFAHLLIRELAFESGYSAASLTERIYARIGTDGAPGMAGVLIYTAAGDQEGTLGGLARQAEPERLLSTLLSALTRASWCSSDPICRESAGQGVGAMNLAACHACALVAETSCRHANALLDRALVVGAGPSNVGFFERAFSDVLNETAIRTADEAA